MNDLLRLVDSLLIPHSAFEEALRRMQQCVAYAQAGAHEPVCVALVGESRTGKSRCVESFMSLYPSRRLADGLNVPVLGIIVPSRPTVKSLAELILRAVGATDWERGTENAKTARLVKLIAECGVRAIVLDEFHHFFDKGSQRVQYHVADWLKNFVGETKVALIVSGLPSLQAVIDQNEQLAGRFSAPVRMPRFDWLDDEHRAEWFAILEAFDVGLRSEFDLPKLDGDDLALRMYCATGGLMGYLTKTLRQAVWNAVESGTKVITLKDLERAHGEAVWSREQVAHLKNPFSRDVAIFMTPELLAQTRLIGTPIIQAPADARVRRGRTVASVLSARRASAS